MLNYSLELNSSKTFLPSYIVLYADIFALTTRKTERAVVILNLFTSYVHAALRADNTSLR
ncbi:MAG: hypothetical protein H0X02_10380 [Nitrosomonas sp.]|nr:hypothetical protein [Nitrosomonas sp.]